MRSLQRHEGYLLIDNTFGPGMTDEFARKTWPGKVVPTAQTRNRDSTERCYACMNITHVTIEYYIIIVETPYARYVLGKANPLDQFKATSVMALAKVDQATGGLQNT